METVTISKQKYKELLVDKLLFSALKNGGVDNWEWYSESINNLLDDCKIIYGIEIENENEKVDLFDLISEKIIEERVNK